MEIQTKDFLPYIELDCNPRKERDFNKRYKEKLTNLWKYCEIIPDIDSLQKRPYDMYWHIDFVSFAIESKEISQDKMNIMKHLKPHQIFNLRLHWNWYVIVYNKKINKYVIIPFSQVEEKQVKVL